MILTLYCHLPKHSTLSKGEHSLATHTILFVQLGTKSNTWNIESNEIYAFNTYIPESYPTWPNFFFKRYFSRFSWVAILRVLSLMFMLMDDISNKFSEIINIIRCFPINTISGLLVYTIKQFKTIIGCFLDIVDHLVKQELMQPPPALGSWEIGMERVVAVRLETNLQRKGFSFASGNLHQILTSSNLKLLFWPTF